VIDSLSRPFVSSAATAIGALQWSPPSVDLETRIALFVSKASKLSEIAYRSPFGANVTHGSDARSYVPPEHFEVPGTTTRCHEPPWFVLTLATRPREPPSFQRSCWYSATMFCAFVGLIAARGSTSAFG
jgi:hypothetical protein